MQRCTYNFTWNDLYKWSPRERVHRRVCNCDASACTRVDIVHLKYITGHGRFSDWLPNPVKRWRRGSSAAASPTAAQSFLLQDVTRPFNRLQEEWHRLEAVDAIFHRSLSSWPAQASSLQGCSNSYHQTKSEIENLFKQIKQLIIPLMTDKTIY